MDQMSADDTAVRLLFTRTAEQGAQVGHLPVSVWRCETGAGAVGTALVAEIIPAPGLHYDEVRRVLLLSLNVPEVQMHLRSTDRIVDAQGVPARLWFGTLGLLHVVAMVCAIQPANDEMDRVLAEHFRPLAVNARMVEGLTLPPNDIDGPLR